MEVWWVPDAGLYCSEDCILSDFRGQFPKYGVVQYTYEKALEEIEDLLECSCMNCSTPFIDIYNGM